MNNPLLYTDPSGYTWKIFKPFEKAWNWFWDKGDQFASWAAQTDWFPSSGGAGVNSAGETWHSVGESGPIYHNQLGNDYGGVVDAAISDARGREAFVSGSSLAGAAGSGTDNHPWYSIYNWPVLGSSARSMDALYAGDYVSASTNFLTCAAEVFTFGYASTASVGNRVTTRAAKSTIGNIKIPVYRVYGGASKIN